MTDIRQQMLCSLQVEFKVRQQATRFVKLITKDRTLSQYYDGKAERCVWLKFETQKSRESVKAVLLKQVSGIEVRYRDTGVDYLFAE